MRHLLNIYLQVSLANDVEQEISALKALLSEMHELETKQATDADVDERVGEDINRLLDENQKQRMEAHRTTTATRGLAENADEGLDPLQMLESEEPGMS